MNTNSIYIHSQSAIPKEYSNLLKEGGSVLVRILKDSGNGRYIASFAGGRYSIASKEKLAPGSTFMAKLSINNGKLNLSKIPSAAQTLNNVSDRPVVQSSSQMTPQVAELLMSLGLPQDGISKMLVQTLVGSGAKINLDRINKARNMALNFPGQEEEAAEAAMILMEKGIEATVENIRDVMTGFSLSGGITENSSELEISEKSDREIEFLAKEIREFFEALLTDGSTERGPGFLTVFNHAVSFEKENKGNKGPGDEVNHWILVPFEFEFEKAKKPVPGTGVFRVFLDVSKKNVQKSVINFYIDGEIWTFVVNFSNKGLERVKFGHCPDLDAGKSARLKDSLSEYFENVPVETVDFQKLCGFGSGDVMLPVAKGYV